MRTVIKYIITRQVQEPSHCSSLSIDLRGRIVIVTGASQGLGLGISHALAQRGGTLYMVCRDHDRGRAAVKAVQNESGNKDVNLRICNLESRQAIRSMTAEFTSKSIRLYLLINNAGVMVRLLHLVRQLAGNCTDLLCCVRRQWARVL